MKRGKPIARKKGVNPINRKRRQSSFARTYGSKARVEFVKGLPCVICATVPSDNAHLHGYGGMGFKGPYDKIIPLCRICHTDYDEYTARISLTMPFNVEAIAEYVEQLWLRWQAHHSLRTEA